MESQNHMVFFKKNSFAKNRDTQSEFFDGTEFTVGPDLPVGTCFHCTVEVEPGRVLVAGGRGDNNGFYIIDVDSGDVEILPDIPVSQSNGQACGVVPSESGGEDYVVAGGVFDDVRTHIRIQNAPHVRMYISGVHLQHGLWHLARRSASARDRYLPGLPALRRLLHHLWGLRWRPFNQHLVLRLRGFWMGPHRKCKQQSCFCLMHSFVFELHKKSKKNKRQMHCL